MHLHQNTIIGRGEKKNTQKKKRKKKEEEEVEKEANRCPLRPSIHNPSISSSLPPSYRSISEDSQHNGTTRANDLTATVQKKIHVLTNIYTKRERENGNQTIFFPGFGSPSCVCVCVCVCLSVCPSIRESAYFRLTSFLNNKFIRRHNHSSQFPRNQSFG